MNPSPDADDGEARFAAYAATPGGALGHADRVAPFRSHCTGPLLPGDRKSVEPMAARMEPGRVGAAHRSLRHFVAGAAWPDEAVPAAVQARALPVIEQKGPIRAWIADDAGVPRKGAHPVGVARQYRGQPGRRDDRRVAVTLPVANDHAGPPLAHRLYPPKPWAGDPARRTGAGVPEDAGFRTKPGIAPDRVRAAPGAGVPPAIVPGDAGHGVDTDFRDGLTGPGPLYVVGIQSSTTLRPPGMAPLPPKPWSGRGRKPVLLRRDGGHQPVSAEDPAFGQIGRASCRERVFKDV